MKSRIFKALIAIIAPIAIEYIVKKISEKLDKKKKIKEMVQSRLLLKT
ncbi:hypothetical protein [Chryseobacterium carnipullorum]|uniref:Uncharacterized protein n=1 Tax=Chryseobacterium carnipullorum TaxID=1124835 RepID=A0A376E7B8_CHRCU|nr:hypothetical protein [Chryseobacterium carnipullorum]STD04118.1 Uncharacterised protein [Chryseobacterium carnipullorum]